MLYVYGTVRYAGLLVFIDYLLLSKKRDDRRTNFYFEIETGASEPNDISSPIKLTFRRYACSRDSKVIFSHTRKSRKISRSSLPIIQNLQISSCTALRVRTVRLRLRTRGQCTSTPRRTRRTGFLGTCTCTVRVRVVFVRTTEPYPTQGS